MSVVVAMRTRLLGSQATKAITLYRFHSPSPILTRVALAGVSWKGGSTGRSGVPALINGTRYPTSWLYVGLPGVLHFVLKAIIGERPGTSLTANAFV